jgi:L-iditol 2-dehydrogenase
VKVARLHGVRDIRLSDEPVPESGAGLSLVRVTAVGLCGSDLHWYGEGGIGDAVIERPLVIGHEFAGVVESGPRAGTRVAVDPAIPCGICALCRDGHPNLCLDLSFAGHSTCDGGLREFVAWPSHLLHPLPTGVSDADGALLEPLGVAVHAMDLGHLKTGNPVAVIGCGPIGLMLIQVAKAAGAGTVFATDPLPHRRQAAQRVGADEVSDELTDNTADVVFEVAGTDAALDAAVLAARPGARIVLVGIPNQDSTTFRASVARRKGLTLLLVRRMKDVYPRAISLVRRGQVDLDSLVSSRYPLEQIADAMVAAASRDGLKVVVG